MPLDLALAKQHLRVLHNDEDALIASYLAAAIAWVERFTGKLLTRRSTEQSEERFQARFDLLYGPDPADLTIRYVDRDGAAQTLTDSLVTGSYVYPDGTWPSAQEHKPLLLEYVAGFIEVPGDLQAAVLLLVGEFYAKREASEISTPVKTAVEALAAPYRDVRV